MRPFSISKRKATKGILLLNLSNLPLNFLYAGERFPLSPTEHRPDRLHSPTMGVEMHNIPSCIWPKAALLSSSRLPKSTRLVRVFSFSLKPLVCAFHVLDVTQAVSGLKLKPKTRASPCIKGSTSAVSTETAVLLSAKCTMEYCAFQPPLWGSGGGQGGVRLVTVELERFDNRVPLEACLLDIEKRPHCKI